METPRQGAAVRRRRAVARWLAGGCVLILAVAWAPGARAQQAMGGGAPVAAAGLLTLDGGWRFQLGDDPGWAAVGLDDSGWQKVMLRQALSEQGVSAYTGYGWYRLILDPRTLGVLTDPAGKEPLELLVTPNSVGQVAVYIDGVEAGRSEGMTATPRMYRSLPFAVRIPAGPTGAARVVAIRSWAGVEVKRGALAKVQLGSHDEVALQLLLARGRQWNEQATAPLVLGFLFLCVAGLGAALYLSQRHHSEYLWLALLGLAVAAQGGIDAAFGLALMPVESYRVLSMFAGRVFMAVTLEFVLRSTTSAWRRPVRILQAAILVAPVAELLGWEPVHEVLSVASEVAFCATVCGMLFVAWRRGRNEAGVMLLPFFLAATADSADTVLDYAARQHWLPQSFASHRYFLGPIAFDTSKVAYTVFLGSLIAVILHRFVRVSQDEQRTEAEIAAARSVQALLIPTELPSNHNFMLESAYLPVQGVGGDFFQVLPLADESLLIVVGDVSGKGLQAAMNSSTLVGALRNELSNDPKTILGHLNRVLLGAVAAPGKVPELDAAPCFATCLCARVYPGGRTVIANAGHLNPYRDGREMALEPSLPLGVIAGVEYEQSEFQLEHGDRLVFLSDGVVEATNAEGELFGFERTQQVSHEPPSYIAQTAKRFGQTDDITVVSLYLASRTAAHARREEEARQKAN